MNGWIVYTREESVRNELFINRFLENASSFGIDLRLVLVEDLTIGIEGHNPIIKYNGVICDSPDFVIMRTIHPVLSIHFEEMGSRVFNSASSSFLFNHKFKTHQQLTKLKIPMMDTYYSKKHRLLDSNLPLDFPFVLKACHGRGGNQVFKVSNPKELQLSLENIDEEEIILQKICPNPGKDLRVFVVGNEVIGAVLRESNGDFRANYSLGGNARFYELNESEKRIIQTVLDNFTFDFVGIDFIFDENNSLIFNEIEDVVGSRTLSATSEVDCVSIYLYYIKNTLKK
jgi:RimK family alpha-L-glutamate ligase